MNLEHYKNFVTIADTGTISGAAEKLLIAQPALTKQIQLLEEKYGTKLMIRKPRKVELTDAGRILYEKVKSICYLEDAAQKEIDACIIGNRGTLRLGKTPAYPDTFLDQLLMDFHRAYPDIKYEIFERNSDQVVELLTSGIIEIGLIRSYRVVPAFLEPVMTVKEDMMVYYHKDHPQLSPDMDSIPLVLLQNWPISISAGLKNSFNLACETEGFQPDYMNVSASRSNSMLWAQDGRTVSIIVSQNSFDQGEFCCRPIEVENMGTLRFFAVTKDRSLSAVANAFLTFCGQHSAMQAWTSSIENVVKNRRGNTYHEE